MNEVIAVKQVCTADPKPLLSRIWKSFRERVWAALFRNASGRRLRLAETLALGERRFVAVVEFEGARFLLGGTTAHITLLARLEQDLPRACACACNRCDGEDKAR